ncbi:hypothetical protein [Desulfopila inferna]|uniref:hypothetical protein n=1 Tax=Desulfopila inferna TaxID=468528 RepID=UPI0019646503|nr:hypothetical protein [Desulfopila inferna]MBM9602811.1 hypothetical protein [Desulfopila inferna]
MNKKISHLRDKIHRLEKKIKETKKRLPAHSVKPPIMMELLDLEDELFELNRQLKTLIDLATREKEES